MTYIIILKKNIKVKIIKIANYLIKNNFNMYNRIIIKTILSFLYFGLYFINKC